MENILIFIDEETLLEDELLKGDEYDTTDE